MISAADTPISESANSIWETFVEALPRLGVAIAVVLVGWGISRGLRWTLQRVFRRNRTPSFARVISRLAAWMFVVVVVLLAVAVTFPSVRPVDLLAGVGFFSVAVGFAFQDILENTLAGVLLLFRQPFRSGDQIDVVGHSGTVVEINIRETQITTFGGEAVFIPNRDVYKNVIVVQTRHPIHRMDFTIGVAYVTDLDLATRTIAAALGSVPAVETDPAPTALVEGLGASSLDIRARFWTDSRQGESLVVVDAAIKAVKRDLDAAGIEIPFGIVVLETGPTFADAIRRSADDPPSDET